MQTIFRAVLKRRPLPPEFEGPAAELSALQGEWDSAYASANAHTPAAAKDAFQGYRTETANSRREGNAEAPRSWEQFKDDYAGHMANDLHTLVLIEQEGGRLAQPICQYYAQQTREISEEIEKIEESQCAEFGVAYSPSSLVLTLRKTADQLRARIPSERGGQPKSLCPFLNL
jgi:hypothetical protein